MKRMMSVMLAAVLALSLAACGKTDNGGSADQSIDLKEFYNTLYQGDDAPAMEELPEDMLEDTYPGLTAIERKQTVAYAAMISAVAAEVAMVEVANAGDAETVKNIFQARIDYMVGDGNGPGGAWYPETMEEWENNSEIVVKGNYVCLFVGENKDDMVSAFNSYGESK